ncbi:MAG: hypothetical protein QF637_11245 [Acidimicrobiales bacterium]|jgi:hypothetical protein|nr:hypothetical protein [Acidimicrobiales bacterium]
MTRIAAYVPNLMDRSRFVGSIKILQTLDELESSDAELVLVDVSKPQVLDHLPSEARVIGFAPHVDTETLESAKAAGCVEALPRSIFFQRLPSLLGVSDG